MCCVAVPMILVRFPLPASQRCCIGSREALAMFSTGETFSVHSLYVLWLSAADELPLSTRWLTSACVATSPILSLTWSLSDGGSPRLWMFGTPMSVIKPWTTVAMGDGGSLDEDYHLSADGWRTSRSTSRIGFGEHRDWFHQSPHFSPLGVSKAEASRCWG